MSKEFSIYLDLVRFASAILVYLVHLNIRAISASTIPLGNSADLGVVAFFLMSGCVIAFVADQKEFTLSEYSASRVARIYSVALPVILFTPILDIAGRHLGSSLYSAYPIYDHPFIRMFISTAFANEIWGWSVLLFSNGPYWSLAYEVPYYVGFGLFFYFTSKWRYAALALLAALVGPKIMLLAPVWCAGVVLYRADAEKYLSSRTACIVAVITFLAVVIYFSTSIRYLPSAFIADVFGNVIHRGLSHSQNFLGYYIVGALVFAHLFSMKIVSRRIGRLLIRNQGWIRYLASFTFALYLFHQPLIYLWASVLRWNPSSYSFAFAITVCVGASTFFIGVGTERLRIVMKKLLNSAMTPAKVPTNAMDVPDVIELGSGHG